MGRPTKMTDATLAKLREAFLLGCSDIEACLYADICPATLYNYQSGNEEFLSKKEMWKNNPFLLARRNVIKEIESGDKQSSQWYLERKKKDEFSPRLENTGANGAPIEVNQTVTRKDQEIIERYIASKREEK